MHVPSNLQEVESTVVSYRQLFYAFSFYEFGHFKPISVALT